NTRFVYSNNNEINITKPTDLFYSETNKVTLHINYQEYKVVGVYKIGTPNAEYDALKQAADNDTQYIGESSIPNKWEEFVTESLLPSVMVTEAFMKESLSSNNSFYYGDYFMYTSGDLKIWIESEDKWSGGIYSVSKLDGEKVLKVYDFNGNPVTALPNNSVALSIYRVGDLYAYAYRNYVQKINSSYEEQERIEAIWQELRLKYEQEHLLTDKNFNSELFENDKENWELNYQWAKEYAEMNGFLFDDDSYREENPYPQKLDQYDWGNYKYYTETQEYRDELDKYRNEIYETAGTISAYKTLLYNARMKAEQEYRKNNPEPVYPENPTGAELDEYYNLHNAWENKKWQAISIAQDAVDPIYKLNNINSLELTQEEILALFKETADLFEGLC
ncbi:MAG: hypothetical protein K2K15_05615, partial [Anaeroplasmataceae bacterium]|nr:hypothetical protein [Anaeroplasmataceae bacterium]